MKTPILICFLLALCLSLLTGCTDPLRGEAMETEPPITEATPTPEAQKTDEVPGKTQIESTQLPSVEGIPGIIDAEDLVIPSRGDPDEIPLPEPVEPPTEND